MIGGVFGGHYRLFVLTTTLAPYAEAGLNIYNYSVTPSDHPDAEDSLFNIGPSLGFGLHYRPKSGIGIRLGALVHFARIDVGVDGADEGDGQVAVTLGTSWPWESRSGTTD